MLWAVVSKIVVSSRFVFLWGKKLWQFQEAEAPIFQDSWHMNLLRSALHTGRLYSFLLEAEPTPGP